MLMILLASAVVIRGLTIDDILRDENEKLTEERTLLQQQIKQLEEKLGVQEPTVEERPSTDAVCDTAPLLAASSAKKAKKDSK